MLSALHAAHVQHDSMLKQVSKRACCLMTFVHQHAMPSGHQMSGNLPTLHRLCSWQIQSNQPPGTRQFVHHVLLI